MLSANDFAVYVDFPGRIFLLSSSNKRVNPVLFLDCYSEKQYFDPDYKHCILPNIFLGAVLFFFL